MQKDLNLMESGTSLSGYLLDLMRAALGSLGSKGEYKTNTRFSTS